MPFQAAAQVYPSAGAYSLSATQSGRPYMYKPKLPVTDYSQPTTQRLSNQSPAALIPPTTATGFSATATETGQFTKQRFEIGKQNSPSQQHAHATEQQHMTARWRISGSENASPSTNLLDRASATSSVSSQSDPFAQQRSQAKPSWQVHSSIYQRYPFFYTNHNR